MDIDFGHESFDEDDDAFVTEKDSNKGGLVSESFSTLKKFAESLKVVKSRTHWLRLK